MDRPWPNLLARLSVKGAQVPLLVVGFATNKAKNVDVWERTVPVPSIRSIPDDLLSCIGDWEDEGKRLEKRVARSKKAATAAIAAIRPHVEARVSENVGDLLAGKDGAWQEAADEYRPMMKVIARSLAPGFTTAALRRRRDIAGALPDMGPPKCDRKEGDR
jgi:hypothetical protein